VKVALVGNWPPPRGGLSLHVASLAAALERRGADVRVLDVGVGGHLGGRVSRARGPLPLAAALARAATERRLVHVHTNGANAKSWVVAAMGGLARSPGASRAVLTIHSGLCPAWLGRGHGRRLLAAAACRAYGRVLAVNDEIAAALALAGVPREKLEVVPPFSPVLVGARRSPGALPAFRAAHAPLFAAALAPGPTYGADVLVPAFREVRERSPRAGLVVFGPGTAADPSLRAGGVLALGEVAHDLALGAIEAADVFVRPTRADGDALSVHEALALGRRVVASGAGRRPPGCLIVPAGDATALAEGMLRAAALPAPAATPPAPDPFDRILRLYEDLARMSPLPDGGREGGRASTF
jgi:glycosyltransferase involved in cell wall biosynthesis